MRRFLFVIWLATFGITIHAQVVHTSRGKEFYGMIMQNSGAVDGSAGPGSHAYFRVSLSSQFFAQATISITDQSWDTSVTIAPDSVSTVELPLSAEVTDIETPELKAIHVTADTDISVYVIYHKVWSSDSYLALPVTALGNEYIAVCYPSCASFPDSKASEFGIIATEDSTIVTITPRSTTLMQHTTGMPFSVILSKGEVYLVYGDPANDNSDLTGSRVTATKPIAFLSGHDRTEIVHDLAQSRNCIVEQIPPKNTLGTSFITTPFAGRSHPVDDYFRVVAPENSTAIFLNDSLVSTIDAGQFYEFHTQQPTRIQTSSPVVLAQYSQSVTDSTGNYPADPTTDIYPWDPTMMIISPTQDFMNDYIVPNPIDSMFTGNYINIIVSDSGISSLMFDEKGVTAQFHSIPGSGYSYAQVPVSQGSHHIHGGEPFGLYVYGFGLADAYANMGGIALNVSTDIHEIVTTPIVLSLDVAPDPIIGNMLISYNVGISGHVRIELFDLLGREVTSLLDEDRAVGKYVAFFPAGDIPPGSYFLTLQSNRYRVTKRVVVLK